MTLRVRSRSLPVSPAQIGTTQDSPAYAFDPVLDFGTESDEDCIDELHKRVGRAWDSGGPFDLSKTWTTGTHHGYLSGWSLPFWARLTSSSTALRPPPANAPLPSVQWTKGAEQLDLESYGASAIDRFRPGKPTVNLGVTIAELRDAPRLMFKRLNSLRNAGSNYLAAQFGWKPFLHDLFSFMEDMFQLDAALANYQKQFGTPVRRSGEVDSASVIANPVPLSPDFIFTPDWDSALRSKSGTRVGSARKTIWFSGKFEFPPLPEMRWSPFGAAYTRMHGLRLTPDVVWELLPWSWLIDWGVNIGDLVANSVAISIDGMIIHYAYLMGTYEYSIKDSAFGTVKFWKIDFSEHSISAESERKTHRKLRTPADFAALQFTTGEISLYQLSILAALGLSKS